MERTYVHDAKTLCCQNYLGTEKQRNREMNTKKQDRNKQVNKTGLVVEKETRLYMARTE